MSWFTDIFFGFISLYLALVNTVAQPLFNLSNTEEYEVDYLAKLDSAYENKSVIPDILIKNSSYQKAALFEGFTPNTAITNDPREALVNIICTQITDKYKRTTTGTGFFIHPSGVILTNAHVAQLLLLENSKEVGDLNCIIRTGNPASPMYEASLLYIPPSWILAHANQITADKPSGTGERDYALLYVTAGLDNKPMPQVFPAIGVETDPLTYNQVNAKVRVSGYPAAAFFTEGPSVELIPKIASSAISDIYTFGNNTADIFSIRGTEIGQQGSSGGPIVNEIGHVIGLISTKGDDSTDGVGSLRALTMDYINRTIREETGYSFEQSINGNLPYRAQIFKDTLFPFLSKLLEFEMTE